jgi:hypothetical protein
MGWPVFLLNLAIIFLGVRYLLRQSKRDQRLSAAITDPAWRRGQRLGNVALIVGTCGILLILGHMLLPDPSPSRTVVLILGVVVIVSAFVLSFIAGATKGGSSARDTDVQQR